MNVMVKTAGGYRVYCKGASEIVFAYCQHFLTQSGSVEPLDAPKRNEIDDVINQYASNGLFPLTFSFFFFYSLFLYSC